MIVDHDSWNVSGLQGTGSKTVAIDEPVFVPAHRILPIGAIFSGKVPGLDVPGNAQARFGYPTFGPTALVAPIVGMAQGALDAFTETARGAKRMARPGVFEKVAESQLIQSLIGQAAARIDAARTLMLTSLREGQDVVRSGGTLEIEQRVRIRRNHGFAGRTSSEVVNEIYAKSGAAAADEKNRIQRFLAGRQHCGAASQHRLGYAVRALWVPATGLAAPGHLLSSHSLRPMPAALRLGLSRQPPSAAASFRAFSASTAGSSLKLAAGLSATPILRGMTCTCRWNTTCPPAGSLNC